MSDNSCAICNVLITENNNSNEHIIPNSLGGRRKIKGFICNECNCRSGNTWDAELAKQLNQVSLFLCIKRERGEPPAQNFDTTTGQKIKLYPDASLHHARPEFQEELWESGKGVQIKFSARSEDEAESILKGLKKKYPQLNLDEARSGLKRNKSYFSDALVISSSIGDENSGRSIVKTAIAMAANAGIRAHDCEFAIDYLKNLNAEACYGFYYEKDLVLDRPLDIPFHNVTVVGCPDRKLVLAYIEYFSAFRFVLCLSSTYTGNTVNKSYSINPITGEELNISVDLDTLSIDDVRAAYKGKKAPEELMCNAFAALIHIAEKVSYKRAEEKAIFEAVNDYIKQNGENEWEFENINQLVNKITERLVPLILHTIKSQKKDS